MSWYDVSVGPNLAAYNSTRKNARPEIGNQQYAVIAPTLHCAYTRASEDTKVGERSMGDARLDYSAMQYAWFDHFLKGIDTGMLNEAPIKLFVMGANVWRDEQEWPLARAVNTRYYLHSNGHANTLHGDGVLRTETPASDPSDAYTYDPAHPVLTRGGALLMTPEFPGGPFDQRETESREDVLVYSTPELTQDVEVTGPIMVHLWATSSATDTDFVARLVDVYPNGYAQNLTDGIIRARYRAFPQGEQPSLIEPGKAYEYEIDLWATSNVFKAGHRIRVYISSSNFPRFNRNLNTGEKTFGGTRMMKAQQTIYHDAEHPSAVLLPIIPR